MLLDIKGLEKRTVRSWFDDGIGELALGIFCAWLALYFAAQAVAPDKSTFKFVVDVGFLPWFLLGGWIMPKLVRSLKQGLTYRRTGFVAYRRPEKKTRVRRALISGIAAGLVSFGFVFLFSHRPSFVDPVPIISGLAFTAVLLAFSFRTGAWRLIPVAAAVAACGTFLSLRGWSDSLNLVAFYAFTAAALFVSGGLTLALYLRRNPIQPGVGE